MSSIIDIDPSLIFHMFRKSATTWAFHKGIPMQVIMQHGTWLSAAVWRYIQSLPTQSSQVLFNTIFISSGFSLGFGRHLLYIYYALSYMYMYIFCYIILFRHKAMQFYIEILY